MNPSHVLEEEIEINAAPERVFAAWTEAGHMTAWWKNDAEFRTEHFESDLRVGGKWLVRFGPPTDRPLARKANICVSSGQPI